MRLFALELRDYREAAGQLLRLVLVPLGHAFGMATSREHWASQCQCVQADGIG